MTTPALVPAFADPVLHAQQSFRAALKVMSEPGVVEQIDLTEALDCMHPATFCLALTLFDDDTQVWLGPSLDTPAVRANLAFHCACPIVTDPAQADMAVISAQDVAYLSQLRIGTDRDPDISCTVIMQLASLNDGTPVVLRGPGIESEREIAAMLDESFWQVRNQITPFPCGLDFFLTSQREIMALPRSTAAHLK